MKKKTLQGDAYDTWFEGFKGSCQANFTGPSGGMEVEAAKVLWGRSLEFKMRYTEFIGDGDSGAEIAITNMDPYRLGSTIDFSLFLFVKFTNFKAFKHPSNEVCYAHTYFLNQVHSLSGFFFQYFI